MRKKKDLRYKVCWTEMSGNARCIDKYKKVETKEQAQALFEELHLRDDVIEIEACHSFIKWKKA